MVRKNPFERCTYSDCCFYILKWVKTLTSDKFFGYFEDLEGSKFAWVAPVGLLRPALWLSTHWKPTGQRL